MCVQTGEPHVDGYRRDHAAPAEADDAGSSCIQHRFFPAAGVHVPRETRAARHTAGVRGTGFSLTGDT